MLCSGAVPAGEEWGERGRRHHGGERGSRCRQSNDDQHDGGCCVGNGNDELANRVEVYALHYPSVVCNHPVVQGGRGQYVQGGRWHRGNSNDKGEASKGTTMRGNKGEANKGTVGNGNAKGEARWEVSEGAMSNGHNEGEPSEGNVGNGHRQVKLPWATVTTRGTRAKALWAMATMRGRRVNAPWATAKGE
jgi:hypothetical protein